MSRVSKIDWNRLHRSKIEDQNRTLLDYFYLFDKYKRRTTLESISKLEFQAKD